MSGICAVFNSVLKCAVFYSVLIFVSSVISYFHENYICISVPPIGAAGPECVGQLRGVLFRLKGILRGVSFFVDICVKCHLIFP